MQRRYERTDTLPPWAYGEGAVGVGLLERAGIEDPVPGQYPPRGSDDEEEGPHWLFASALDRLEGKEAREAFYRRL